MLTVVPGLSAPAKDAEDGWSPVTFIVQAEAVAVPPLSLMTCLMTVSVAGWSSFVIVQVGRPATVGQALARAGRPTRSVA